MWVDSKIERDSAASPTLPRLPGRETFTGRSGWEAEQPFFVVGLRHSVVGLRSIPLGEAGCGCATQRPATPGFKRAVKSSKHAADLPSPAAVCRTQAWSRPDPLHNCRSQAQAWTNRPLSRSFPTLNRLTATGLPNFPETQCSVLMTVLLWKMP